MFFFGKKLIQPIVVLPHPEPCPSGEAVSASVELSYSCQFQCSCSTCHVFVMEGGEHLSSKGTEEAQMLAGTGSDERWSRLPARAYLGAGATWWSRSATPKRTAARIPELRVPVGATWLAVSILACCAVSPSTVRIRSGRWLIHPFGLHRAGHPGHRGTGGKRLRLATSLLTWVSIKLYITMKYINQM